MRPQTTRVKVINPHIHKLIDRIVNSVTFEFLRLGTRSAQTLQPPPPSTVHKVGGVRRRAGEAVSNVLAVWPWTASVWMWSCTCPRSTWWGRSRSPSGTRSAEAARWTSETAGPLRTPSPHMHEDLPAVHRQSQGRETRRHYILSPPELKVGKGKGKGCQFV